MCSSSPWPLVHRPGITAHHDHFGLEFRGKRSTLVSFGHKFWLVGSLGGCDFEESRKISVLASCSTEFRPPQFLRDHVLGPNEVDETAPYKRKNAQVDHHKGRFET